MELVEGAVDRRQGRHRVDFKTNVKLSASDEERIVVAQTANLSESGMFVLSPDTYDVGTRLFCSLFHRPHGLAVTGRVTRVESGDFSGMGIEFVDLSSSDLARLQRIIASGQPRSWFRPVRVYLQGVELPIQAQATQIKNELVISSYLRFLRLGAEATILPKDGMGEGFSGTLNSISVNSSRIHPFPMLSLHFDVNQSADDNDRVGVDPGLMRRSSDTDTRDGVVVSGEIFDDQAETLQLSDTDSALVAAGPTQRMPLFKKSLTRLRSWSPWSLGSLIALVTLAGLAIALLLFLGR